MMTILKAVASRGLERRILAWRGSGALVRLTKCHLTMSWRCGLVLASDLWRVGCWLLWTLHSVLLMSIAISIRGWLRVQIGANLRSSLSLRLYGRRIWRLDNPHWALGGGCGAWVAAALALHISYGCLSTHWSWLSSREGSGRGVYWLLYCRGRRLLDGYRWSVTIALGWRKSWLTRFIIVQERHDAGSLANGLLLTNCSHSWWLWARSHRRVLVDMRCRYGGTRKLRCWIRHQSRCSSSDTVAAYISRSLSIS